MQRPWRRVAQAEEQHKQSLPVRSSLCLKNNKEAPGTGMKGLRRGQTVGDL
jgi:hypothetical protein